MPPPVRTLRAKLRDFALALPEVHEDMPWGERALKVKNKVFVFLGRDMDPDFGFSVKLPNSNKAALRLPFTSPTGYGLGKSGWVTAKLDDQSQASFEMLRDWVKESYCAVAPKGLAEQVQPDPSKVKAAKKAKASKEEAAKRKTKTVGHAKAASLPIGKRAAKR
ncbi:MAG TPA: MmcQ/YjbR family DNA-binding protein [Polyangiaceae bacterium]|jgi:predicted DNA-binding protein (MmcQ/YjbR family)|nr:MmcQ/YjbR family DNA-binding protein [Polyangiaceae bacterium]